MLLRPKPLKQWAKALYGENRIAFEFEYVTGEYRDESSITPDWHVNSKGIRILTYSKIPFEKRVPVIIKGREYLIDVIIKDIDSDYLNSPFFSDTREYTILVLTH